MILLKPSFEILDTIDAERILKSIERAGRTCYKSENRITEDSARRFVHDRVLVDKHYSILRHEKVTVRIICNRAVSHQLVRHGLASFSQESQRYCNYGKRNGGHVQYIIPHWANLEPGTYTREQDITVTPPAAGTRVWIRSMLRAEEEYKAMLHAGRIPEEARGVLPNDTKTELVITANLEELRHIFIARTSNQADGATRHIMRPLFVEMAMKIPVVFDDITWGE